MKSAKAFLLQIFMMAFLFPAMLLSVVQYTQAGDSSPAGQTEPHYITIQRGGELTELHLEEYVAGVVLAEMPSEFQLEALKAQAVVARTFAWKAASTGGKHTDGTLCTNSACCQGYVSEENYLRYYGTPAEVEKIKSAVYATAGIVITYDGELIEATYFSSSGGSTEDAAAVWGNDYPYLISRESPEENMEEEEITAFSGSYLESILNTRLEGEPDTWFHDWEYTSGGGVARVGIGNRFFSGTELRKALNLRSTLFSITTEHGVVFFHTRGHGHRVGMSQYGAEAMALEGKTFQEILQYYYSGTELKTIGQ